MTKEQRALLIEAITVRTVDRLRATPIGTMPALEWDRRVHAIVHEAVKEAADRVAGKKVRV